jgi:nucleotide-binding universal stress UspA family protein
MRSLLVPVDGSEQAERLAAALALRARREPLRIDLLNVQPRFSSYIAQFIDAEERLRYQRETGERALAGAEQALDRTGLAHASHLHTGEPARAIAAAARELRAHEIVMLDGGRGALGDLLQSILIGRVIRRAEIPVVVLKAPAPATGTALKLSWRRFGYSR